MGGDDSNKKVKNSLKQMHNIDSHKNGKNLRKKILDDWLESGGNNTQVFSN